MAAIQWPGPRPDTKSFSLVEMLVVVAVIAILVAVLLPALRSSRERGRRIACANNEYQILLAIHYYSEDHDGYLPQQANYGPDWSPWSLYLTNYVQGIVKVFRCPSDLNARRGGGPSSEPFRSYAVNGESPWTAGFRIPWPVPDALPMRLADVPTHVLLLGENHGINSTTPPGSSGATVLRSELEGLKGVASADHRDYGGGIASELNPNGGGNYGFPDGRIEFHKYFDYQNPNPAFDGSTTDPWKWQ